MSTRRECELEQDYIKEVAGLELMVQNGITGQWVINRLKDLAKELK